MSLKNALKLLGAHLFRWIGFPVEPDLIKIGNPTKESPVLLTCNFNLTVKRVLKHLKNLDCYLLIAPSKGINVWCGACGDDFTTDSVISIIKTSDISDLVSHKTLILPQLSAPGIDPIIIKKKTGWNVKFGPVYAKDIPEYINNDFKKTLKQTKIRFPLYQRIEMGNTYFIMLFIVVSLIYWIVSFFLPFLDLILYLNTVLILGGMIYGSLLLLPNIPIKLGKPKVWLFELIVVALIIIFDILILQNLGYFIWNLIVSLLTALILSEDFNGLTSTSKSELGEKTWNKGKQKMKVIFGEYKLQPYGEIKIDREKCIGCKVCIEICPRIMYAFNNEDNKVNLKLPEKCINCNACVNRCLAQCLKIL